MTPVLGRRHFMGGALAAGALAGARAGALSPLPEQWTLQFGGDIEQRYGGRLGFAVAFSSGDIVNWRGNERFAFCSSFKLSLAALVLSGAEKGEWRLDEKLRFGKDDVLSNSPALQVRLGQGAISMEEAAEAVQKLSDNGAANLLMRRIGGFDRVNRFWLSLGDTVSRLDDYETALNRVPLGSLRNTTTPEAMTGNLLKMFRHGALSPAVAGKLKGWMHETATGAKRLRAGLPAEWWAGDKTGTGLPADIPGTYVDLAWVEPPQSAPFAMAAFYRPSKPTPDGDSHAEEVLAQVGRIVAQTIVLQGK
ncbi:beta-lactamase class A [Novosphingobium sp. SG751A]|uniref:class A beta-lactamase n=1 Tax=Novosphingobium sp. SG751A TaxID=2587000 RepID=UPI001552F34F|nr:class A beta-lactamase [Novosphingobium sp. SG751A]NOW44617.1 beta-lactamase class A [Novosphingobium sp. SG751A]